MVIYRAHSDTEGAVLPSEPLVSVSNLGSNVTIVRFAAHTAEDGYELLAEMLSPLSSGDLEELPKPYADRIHSLPAGKKRNASLLFDSTTIPFQYSSVDEAHNTPGTAIAAMQQYDEKMAEKNISR